MNGPTVNRALLDSQFPGGQLLRNTGASWDNPDRRTPYTDQVTIGYERQLAGSTAVSADYVHAFSRDLLMSKDLNPGLRATTAVTSALVRQGSATLSQALADLQAIYPGFAPFTTGVSMPVNIGKTDYDALMLSLNKRFSHDFSARVWYTLAYSRGNTTGSGVPTSGFQVLDDLHLELNQGPTAFDTRHNLVISGQALIPHTGGLNVSWVARALSGSPFSLFDGNIDPDRNGSQSEPLAAGDYSGTGVGAYTVSGYKSERNGAYGPGLLQPGRAARLPLRDRRGAQAGGVGRHLQPDKPHQLRHPEREPGVIAVPAADLLQHELHAAQAAGGRPHRVLIVQWTGGRQPCLPLFFDPPRYT